ncbi:MAG: response regulator [Oligoflexales bacterium]
MVMDKEVQNQKDVVNILLVDDKPTNLVALESFLKDDDYNLISATSGAEALENLLKEKEFALILTDVMMPYMDGYEFAQQVKKLENFKDIPIIFLTAMSSEFSDILRGYEVGGVDYLQKPLAPEVVKAKVAVFAELFRQKRLIKRQALQLVESQRKQEELRTAELKRITKMEREQILKDISERKHAEERLKALNEELERRVEERTAEVRRTETQLRLITDAMPIIVAEMDTQQRCLFINKEGQEWLLQTPGEVLGLELQAIVGEDRYTRIKPHLTAVLAGRQVDSEWVMTRNNKIQVLSVNYIPEFDHGGHVNGFIIVAADITQHKEAEEELKRAKKAADDANAAKSAFLANMSHEIRTPLGVVLGFSELLSNESLPASVRNDYVNAIRRNGDLLSTIISDILDLSKVEAGKFDIEMEETPLGEILSDISTTLGPQAAEKGLLLEIRTEGPVPPSIKTDPLRLRQVLTNIVGNAVKFTEKGHVKVVAKQILAPNGATKLAFEVIDSGPGINEDKIAKLFRPFTQADASTKRKYGGTGLGLVLSKRLANLLGGDVVVNQSIPGKGSIFMITIDGGSAYNSTVVEYVRPQDRTESPQRRDGNGFAQLRLEGVKVLLVEDALDNRLLVSRILSVAGAKVETASNGKEAVEKAQENSGYDVILMDLQMPIMDGYEAVASLRKDGYGKPVVALTAHALKEERERCLASGFNDHIQKPINRSALIGCVARYGLKVLSTGSKSSISN